MSKTAIWFFGSNKLNSSNVVQITQRIVTWMMTNRFVHSKPENNVIEHHNPPWMGHCRWCSSLMAIFDAENKWNLVVWVNPFYRNWVSFCHLDKLLDGWVKSNR